MTMMATSQNGWVVTGAMEQNLAIPEKENAVSEDLQKDKLIEEDRSQLW